jgi:hypothetical protein
VVSSGGVLIGSYTGNDPLSAQFLPHAASTEKTRLYQAFDSEGTFASSKARPFNWLGKRWSTRVFALWRAAAKSRSAEKAASAGCHQRCCRDLRHQLNSVCDFWFDRGISIVWCHAALLRSMPLRIRMRCLLVARSVEFFRSRHGRQWARLPQFLRWRPGARSSDMPCRFTSSAVGTYWRPSCAESNIDGAAGATEEVARISALSHAQEVRTKNPCREVSRQPAGSRSLG